MKWSVLLIALLFLAPISAQESNDDRDTDSADEPSRSKSSSSSSSSQQEPNQTEKRPDSNESTPGNETNSTDAKPSVEFERQGNFVGISYSNGTFSYQLNEVQWFATNLTDPKISSRERQIFVESEEGKFVISDNPTGHISYRGHQLDLQFDGKLTDRAKGAIVEHDGKVGFFITDEDRKTFFSFHVKQPAEPRHEKTHAGVEDAIAARKVAARITDEEVESYDDVEISVERPVKATPETPYRVEIGAELSEGRTIVLDIDRTILDGPGLELRYFNLNDDGTETEVVFRSADSLEDILEPTDDAGQPEYWIVEDENGLQVMVSIPHWSTHAVTLASLGTFVQPQVWLGIAAGVVITVVAAGLILRPKRAK